MIVGVTKESFANERRVALTPLAAGHLVNGGCEVRIQRDAGVAAGFADEEYTQKEGCLVDTRDEVFAADVVLQVRSAGANPAAVEDLARARPGQIVIGMADPLGEPEAAAAWAKTGVTLFALELLPRITRAQSMDVLSSMATVAGYRAVLLAAEALPQMFPMMMTAAGTLAPAKVLIVGAGVAGLQAIATARRLGGVVSAYDIRPAVKEQVESLGGRFVEMELSSGESETSGGYAKAMDEDFYRRQRELMTSIVAASDVVITTAAVPGKKAPVLVTGAMVEGMRPGSVLVDLAAERGGNCELTEPGKAVVHRGVAILGPTNLPSEVPGDASRMYAKNITTFLDALTVDGQVKIDLEDEVQRETRITADGEVVHPQVREAVAGIKPS